MSRTKGGKNRPKINITKDYTSRIAEKKEQLVNLITEIAFIQKAIDEQKNTLKEKKTILKMAEKEVATLKAKKDEDESVLKKLPASGMSADEIIEKLK